jgi:hypothetical protein
MPLNIERARKARDFAQAPSMHMVVILRVGDIPVKLQAIQVFLKYYRYQRSVDPETRPSPILRPDYGTPKRVCHSWWSFYDSASAWRS